MLLKKLSTENLSVSDADTAIKTMVGSAVWGLDMITEMRTAIAKHIQTQVVVAAKSSWGKDSTKAQLLRNPDLWVTIPIARFAASPGGVTIAKIDLLAQLYCFLWLP